MTATIRLGRQLRETLTRRALAAYPVEACGLLIGRRRGDTVEIERLDPVANQATRADRYSIDPLDLLAASRGAREVGLDVVGAWHSHPDLPATPSATDRENAWEGFSYLIVSVDARGAAEMRSWRLENHRFEEEALAARPDAQPDARPHTRSTNPAPSAARRYGCSTE